MWYKVDPTKSSPDKESGNKTPPRRSLVKTSQPDLRKTVTYYTIPRTHDGALARQISRTEMELRVVCKTRVKIIECVGSTLKSILVKSNPWKALNCPRLDCLPCKQDDKKFSCTRRNCTYITQCKLCLSEGKKVVYIGETSNSIFERALQHIKSTSEDKEGHMAHHINEKHPGALPMETFSIAQITPHTSAYARQLEEAQIIRTYKGAELLNSKYEYYNTNLIPSLTLNDKKREIMEIRQEESNCLTRVIEAEAESKRKKLWEFLNDKDEERPNKRRKKEVISQEEVMKNRKKGEQAKLGYRSAQRICFDYVWF